MAAEFTERRIQSNGNTTNFNIDRSQPYIDVQKNGQTQRIYGTQEQLERYQNKKPDGTLAQTDPNKTQITKGTALKAFEEARAKVLLDKAETETLKQETPNSNGSGSNLQQLVPNPMEQFASYNTLWTMAVLTPAQFNDPQSYRGSDFAFVDEKFNIKTEITDDDTSETFTKTVSVKSGIIFSSAGRADKQRVSTFYGTPEYYINDFEMNAVISANEKTGNTNAIGFTFTIYEPYSMGLLLQSLQVGAINAGYANYLDAPFLLRLDIKGFSENGKFIKSVKPKFFVMKLKSVKFTVNESGSSYEVAAFPYNHQGFSDTINTNFTDISISPGTAGTVEELLVTGDKSLVNILNQNEKELVDAGKYDVPDIYEIQFPEKSSDWIPNNATTQKDRGATLNPEQPANKKTVQGTPPTNITRTDFGSNPIGKSTFGFTQADGGNFIFTQEDRGFDPDTGRVVRDKLTIDPKGRVFQFTQEQTLTDIIVQCILTSEYAKRAVLDPTTQTPEGYIKWFRLDVQIEFLKYDPSIGDFAKKYTFRVVPYFVHSSIFRNPQSAPIGYQELEKQIAKKYQYIYSGQNVDILDFEIKLNNMFFTGTNPSAEVTTQNELNKDNQGPVGQGATKTKTQDGGKPEAQAGYLSKTKLKKDPALLKFQKGGSGQADVEKKVAENFHNVFINGNTTDLVSIDLEILGDTYWMVDSGMANYFATESSATPQATNDGTANYEGSDVYIYITFRTPSDISEDTGLYKFPQGDKQSPFSGIYKVVRCDSTFADGKWTQKLRCLRMQGQSLDFDNKPLVGNKQNNLVTGVDGVEKDKANTADQSNLTVEEGSF